MNDREIEQVERMLADINSAEYRRLPDRFKCKLCQHPAEHYMVTDDLWRLIHEDEDDDRGVLCIDCLIEKLGRPIGPHDLKPAAINKSLLTGMLLAS